MSVSVASTVQALGQAIAGLLPPQPDPDLVPDVLINPVKTHPAGLGGYVGMNASPQGEIHARQLKAQVVVRIKADNLADLAPAESAVTNALVGSDADLLRGLGIYRISRDTDFSRFYNGRQLPDEGAGVIDSIPLDLLLGRGDNSATKLFDADFDSDPLAGFTALDDSSTSNGPGNWSFNAAQGQVEQSALISGGSNSFNASKRGTYLVLNASQVARLPENFLLQVDLGADSGGIGVVFNFRDIDNFYFFIMSLLTPILSAREDTPPIGGSVGFLSRNCATARFQSMRWLGL